MNLKKSQFEESQDYLEDTRLMLVGYIIREDGSLATPLYISELNELTLETGFYLLHLTSLNGGNIIDKISHFLEIFYDSNCTIFLEFNDRDLTKLAIERL